MQAGEPAFLEHSRGEAVRSLAKAWGLTETRAAGLLDDPDAYGVECRARQRLTGREALRELERRFPCP
jgi:hypothetical protein